MTQEHQDDNSIPLCIDLDGTLVKTDTLFESVIQLVKTTPLFIFFLPFWLLKGKAYFKHKIAQHRDIDVTCLPYNRDVLDILRARHQTGRKLVLATGTDGKIAEKIAQHLKLFSEVLASDGVTNLSGKQKGQVLQEKFGYRGFDYVGNAKADLEVWRWARRALVVSPGRSLLRRIQQICPDTQVIGHRRSPLLSLPRAIRVHQWLKNLLIFVPLVLTHHSAELAAVAQSITAFAAFSLTASCVYLINDMVDLEADRRHPQKQHRPLAAGDFPLTYAVISLAFLASLALVLGSTLPVRFLLLLASYFLVNIIYSFYVKKLVLLDVFVLASLYTIRIVAGGEAIDIAISYWLLTFSIFFFLSLAFLKRYVELMPLSRSDNEAVRGRSYYPSDLDYVANIGSASGFISVLIFTLYINDDTVAVFYKHPDLLWFIMPLLLYWVSRVWLLAHRSHITEDPVLFVVKDKVSYGIVFLIFSLVLAAKWH